MKFSIVLLLLASCSDWTTGVINTPDRNQTFNQHVGNNCINDNDCGVGYMCYKQGNDYVGVCVKPL